MKKGLSRHTVDAIEGKHPIGLDRLVSLGNVLRVNGFSLITDEAKDVAYGEYPIAEEELSIEVGEYTEILVPFYSPEQIQSGKSALRPGKAVHFAPPPMWGEGDREIRELSFLQSSNSYLNSLAPSTVWMNCHSASYFRDHVKQMQRLELALNELGTTKTRKSGSLNELFEQADSEIEAAQNLSGLWDDHHRVCAVDVNRRCNFFRVAEEPIFCEDEIIDVAEFAFYQYEFEPEKSTRFLVLAPGDTEAVILRIESKPLVKETVDAAIVQSALQPIAPFPNPVADLVFGYRDRRESGEEL